MNRSVAENSFWGPPFSNPGAATMNKQHHMNAYLFVFSEKPLRLPPPLTILLIKMTSADYFLIQSQLAFASYHL